MASEQKMTAEEVVNQVMAMLNAYYNEPDDAGVIAEDCGESHDEDTIIRAVTERIVTTLASNISDFGVLDKEEVMKMLRKSR